MNEKGLEISLEEEDEEDDTNRFVPRDDDYKGDDMNLLEPLVVPPPFPTPLFNLIKEEECVDTWETFTEIEEPMIKNEKVFPSDGAFADPQKEISLEGKESILEIRADFKAPQHRVKVHVWGIDLLDPG